MTDRNWVPSIALKTTGWGGRIMGMGIGALAVLGQAPFHGWPLALISLALLLARLQFALAQPRPIRASFSAAFWQAFGYFMAGTYWIGSAFIARGPGFLSLIHI